MSSDKAQEEFGGSRGVEDWEVFDALGFMQQPAKAGGGWTPIK